MRSELKKRGKDMPETVEGKLSAEGFEFAIIVSRFNVSDNQ